MASHVTEDVKRRARLAQRARENAVRRPLRPLLGALSASPAAPGDQLLTLTPHTKSAVVKPSDHTTIATRRFNMLTKREVVPGEFVHLKIQSIGEGVHPVSQRRLFLMNCVTALHGDEIKMIADADERPFFIGYESAVQTLSWELPLKYKNWKDFMKQAWKAGSDKPKLVMGIGLPSAINLSEMKRVS